MRSYVWSILEPIFMVHEVGHLMCARHVYSGLMEATWSPSKRIVFSSSYVLSIRNFIEKYQASSCLNYNTGGRGVLGGTVTSPSKAHYSGDTCAASLNRNNGLICFKKSTSIDLYNSKNNFIWKTTAKLSQHNGQFHYLLIGGNFVRIHSVRFMVRYDGSISIDDMKVPRYYSGSGSRIYLSQNDGGPLSLALAPPPASAKPTTRLFLSTTVSVIAPARTCFSPPVPWHIAANSVVVSSPLCLPRTDVRLARYLEDIFLSLWISIIASNSSSCVPNRSHNN